MSSSVRIKGGRAEVDGTLMNRSNNWRATSWTPPVVILLAVLGVIALSRHQWPYGALLLALGSARAYVFVRARATARGSK
jgi:hypothetical protein